MKYISYQFETIDTEIQNTEIKIIIQFIVFLFTFHYRLPSEYGSEKKIEDFFQTDNRNEINAIRVSKAKNHNL